MIPLAKAGLKIWGLEISPSMLKVCKRKVALLPDRVKRRIHLVWGDMADFKLPKRFNLIFIAARSFQFLLTKQEQESALKCVFQHLNENGIFIIDLFAPLHRRLAQEKMHEVIPPIRNSSGKIEYLRSETVRYDLAKQVLFVERVYDRVDKKGNVKRIIWEFSLRYIFRYEMELLLEKNGFKVVNLFGSFDKKEYDYHSGEMIFVARKV